MQSAPSSSERPPVPPSWPISGHEACYLLLQTFIEKYLYYSMYEILVAYSEKRGIDHDQCNDVNGVKPICKCIGNLPLFLSKIH